MELDSELNVGEELNVIHVVSVSREFPAVDDVTLGCKLFQ